MKESNAPAVGRTPFQKWLDKYQGIALKTTKPMIQGIR